MSQQPNSAQFYPWIRPVPKEPIPQETFKQFGDQCRWFWEEDVQGGNRELFDQWQFPYYLVLCPETPLF